MVLSGYLAMAQRHTHNVLSFPAPRTVQLCPPDRFWPLLQPRLRALGVAALSATQQGGSTGRGRGSGKPALQALPIWPRDWSQQLPCIIKGLVWGDV
jgi:hypothetical protein